jgi:pseudomonalisin
MATLDLKYGRSAQLLVTGLFAIASLASAQTQSRLPQVVRDSVRTRLAGTTHPLANPANEIGRAPSDLAMSGMLLVLKATAAQEADLATLVAAQQNPSSPQYHQWLTPAQFGERFGPSQADVAKVSSWLQSQGFTIDNVASGRRSIQFSGSAGQVEGAFQTEMHHYMVDGVRRLANSTDISIPTDLASVVDGVQALHEFHAKPLYHSLAPLPGTGLAQAVIPAGSPGADALPQLTTSSGSHALAPGDFATIYNVAPLYSAGIDGTGQTIAVVGRTNFNMSDVTTFRSTFGLPVNNPAIVLNGANPGIISTNEEVEALLDVEWSGAVAKNATIKFVLSANTNTTGGETLSAQYAVQNNIAPVLSTSFGLCEAQMGSSNQFYNSLWQQAAAQGISVIAAAGDSGAAGCDVPGSASSATRGLGISGIASTPYNTAIGGTQLNEGSTPAAYWSSTNSASDASALSYIPEVVWNDSAYVAAGSTSNNLYAGSGGLSTLYATPSWQTGTGVPTVDPNTTSGHHRYIPDVSLSAAGHDPYAIMLNGALSGVSGTSAGAPSFAGLMALLNQKLNARVGNPATSLYALATSTPAAFHDIVTGTNAVPCTIGTANCVPNASGTIGADSGWVAGTGFDMATGLGTVNAYNMVMSWPTTTVTPPPATPVISSLNPNPMTTSTTAQTLTINGSGFVSGTGLQVQFTANGSTTTLSNTQITFVSASQLQVSIIPGAVAKTYAVKVVNPSGTASGAVNLVVNAPVATTAPVISSLNPTALRRSNSGQLLTINGSNFVSGAKLVFGYPGGSTTIPANQFTFVSSTQLRININVGTTARTLTMQVLNPNGSVSNTVQLPVQ